METEETHYHCNSTMASMLEHIEVSGDVRWVDLDRPQTGHHHSDGIFPECYFTGHVKGLVYIAMELQSHSHAMEVESHNPVDYVTPLLAADFKVKPKATFFNI